MFLWDKFLEMGISRLKKVYVFHFDSNSDIPNLLLCLTNRWGHLYGIHCVCSNVALLLTSRKGWNSSSSHHEWQCLFPYPNIDGSYPLEKILCLLIFFLLKMHCLNCPSLNVNETKHVSSCPHVFIGYLYFICELLVYILG